MDLLQREDSFSFIHSYLLVVKVGQMFSIMQHKCQAIGKLLPGICGERDFAPTIRGLRSTVLLTIKGLCVLNGIFFPFEPAALCLN